MQNRAQVQFDPPKVPVIFVLGKYHMNFMHLYKTLVSSHSLMYMLLYLFIPVVFALCLYHGS